MLERFKAQTRPTVDKADICRVLPIHIKVNWLILNVQLRTRGFLNKKFRPGVVARLTSLGAADIIKYFNQVLHSYLSFFRCVDDFTYVKARFF